ncbi:MAG: DUF6689 family protein [Woeseia sp.]
MPTIHKILLPVILSVLPLSAARASIDALTIDGNEARASIALPGGITADLAIRFESAVGLSAESLGLSVQLVDPLSPVLAGALPGTDVSIPSAFPVLLTIAAPAEAGLAFEGVVEIELYTRNLHYSADSILRLFSSSNGQPFRDITAAASAGSYRVRGTSGEFSDFLILADDRPLHDLVESNFTRLDESLTAHSAAIDPTVANQLELLLANAYLYWQAGDPGAAVEQIRLLGSTVRAAADAEQIPGVWRSSRDLPNVAGVLRANARVLRFTLGLSLAGTQ